MRRGRKEIAEVFQFFLQKVSSFAAAGSHLNGGKDNDTLVSSTWPRHVYQVTKIKNSGFFAFLELWHSGERERGHAGKGYRTDSNPGRCVSAMWFPAHHWAKRPVPVVQMPLLVCIHWSTTAQINPVLYLAEFLISFYTAFVYTLIFGDLVLLI